MPANRFITELFIALERSSPSNLRMNVADPQSGNPSAASPERNFRNAGEAVVIFEAQFPKAALGGSLRAATLTTPYDSGPSDDKTQT